MLDSADEMKAASDAGSAALSTRQLEVLDMAAMGLTNREIASRLCVSIHAVKFHLAAIYAKLGVTNRTEAAVRYLQTAGQGQPAPASTDPDRNASAEV